jgi:hypothetical protein
MSGEIARALRATRHVGTGAGAAIVLDPVQCRRDRQRAARVAVTVPGRPYKITTASTLAEHGITKQQMSV